MAGACLVRLCTTDTAAAAWGGIHAPDAAAVHRHVSGGDPGYAVSLVCRILDRGNLRRYDRPARGREPSVQCRGPTDRPSVGSFTEGGALSGATAAVRLQPSIQDHPGCRRRAVSDTACNVLRRIHG